MGKLVLIDLDNTLINRNGAMADWVADFGASRRLSPEAAHCLAEGLRERATVATFDGLRCTLGLVESAAQLWDRYVTGMAARVVCRPTTLSRLDQLRAAGWSARVLTNGSADIQRAKIAAAGILGRVDGVYISEEIGVRKPDPRAFHAATEWCDSQVSGVGWMVGDNPMTDIAGASAIGLRTIWISAGRPWMVPGLAPDHIAETANDALDFLLGLPEDSR
ncbi:HAD family hydrolase [Kitasatospora sp. NPDC058115]|uniref:HAD family hydrolase n=1 Tax=Kitasatospora sp. NPDC058115 TaxID=3346347 RepID=UPI0036D7E1B5